jgi:hypothetical protein
VLGAVGAMTDPRLGRTLCGRALPTRRCRRSTVEARSCLSHGRCRRRARRTKRQVSGSNRPTQAHTLRLSDHHALTQRAHHARSYPRTTAAVRGALQRQAPSAQRTMQKQESLQVRRGNETSPGKPKGGKRQHEPRADYSETMAKLEAAIGWDIVPGHPSALEWKHRTSYKVRVHRRPRAESSPLCARTAHLVPRLPGTSY